MIELSWRVEPDGSLLAEVTALAAAAAEADGAEPLSEAVLLQLRGSGGAQVLARDARGALVGFAHLDLPAADPAADPAAAPDPGPAAAVVVGELVVHPGHRRAGLGTRIVEELVARTEAAAGGQLRLWAHGEHPGAVALAARLGFSRVRELWQMRRSLAEPVPDPAMPEGVRLRPFAVGADEPEFLRVNNAAFHWHPEQGGWGLDQVTQREVEPWFDPKGFLLAVDADDRLLGYHWTKVHPATGVEEPIGEVYVLGVDPAAQGRGLGPVLTAAGLRHLRELGLARVMLYVEGDNAAAIRVYERLGFTRWSTDVLFAR